MNLPDCEKTLALLEFYSIREAAASCSLSPGAARIIREEIPLFDKGAVKNRKDLVLSFCNLLENPTEGKLQELPDVEDLFLPLGVEGSVLGPQEILALGLFIERGEELRRFVLEGRGAGEKLRDMAGAGPDCSFLAREIFRILDRDGRVRDLPALKQIRSRIQGLTRELEQIASRYGAGENTRQMLQSPLPSQRDGRIVLAVKANFRGRIRGIIHEVSSTGQTIFVEPEEAVELNNRILVEEANLEAELRRILRELTGRIAQNRGDLENFHRLMVDLESLRARAQYSRETGGCFALDTGSLALRQARHPLLGKGAIPIDLVMDPRTTMVIITGPNTGGKTAALKTLGLLALMNQAGLAVPAAAAELPVFDGIYADIGDEQSLSQSLSTFSAHMTNIGGIIKNATDRSLVLLDELGAGTDPEEGSAIAMAVLDHFTSKKTTVILTTHHGMLKNYGYSREGVENASVEFDRRTLSPTYRIIMGIPGESRAVDIAARNGLPPALVDSARAYLEGERSDVSALIAGLKEKHRELDEAARSVHEKESRIREDRRRTDLKELTLRQREYLLKKEGAREFRRFLLESRKTLENLVREIREGELTRDKTLRVKKFIKELEAGSSALTEALEAEEKILAAPGAEQDNPPAEGPPFSGSGGRGPSPEMPRSGTIGPGAEVLAGPSQGRGRVIRRDRKARTGSSGQGGSGRDAPAWVVEIGSVRMSFLEEELVPVRPSAAPGSTGKTAGWSAELDPDESRGPKLELNVLGMRLDEALGALRRQIDGAILGGLREFSVVHGKGDGILQRGVQNYLKNDPAVEDYYFSRPEFGGFGRTEVVLKG
ncbi:MAG: Smr/MutS family protein [Spirochaetaceae bacterium]|jgi:DNA mismatch repair protein MutS2|nr:Smr/MutS family protein [Spirochaetaceae bacterium]